MSSVLSSFFARDPRNNFAYELPSESFCSWNGIKLGASFKKGETNVKATAFSSSANELRAHAQKLKTLRHPNVLIYLDSIEIDSQFYLITEPCKPLRVYMEEVMFKDAQKELVVSWGIYQVLSCLKFLHTECKFEQGSMKDAIFVNASGDWKLGAFHHMKQFNTPKNDFNDLACVIWQIFNGFNHDAVDAASGKIPKRLLPLYKKLGSRNQTFLADDILSDCRAVGGFMKNKFVDTLLFLEEFQLKDSTEKQSFFIHLKDNLSIFPDDIAKYKILPKLIHMYEYGDAGSHILIPMFKLGRLLDEDEYQHRIVPCLVKLFSSPDRTTRVKLLDKIDEFAPHLKPNVVNEKIYSNIVTGFLDTNPAVRESTVKAMVSLADKLNYHNLNVDLMKYLARLQGGDDQPGIRTNTTICLGKIGCYIDASQRQKILISAFTRALKDPFPPARMSGVLALGATQQYYSLSEVATRILPALSLLTVDPEKPVREQGFKALKGFLEKLEKASENPGIIPELEAEVNAGGKSGLLSAEKVPQWAGWAIKTISGKFYKPSVAVAESAGRQPSPDGESNAAKQPNMSTECTNYLKNSGWSEADNDDDDKSSAWSDGEGWSKGEAETKSLRTTPIPESNSGWNVEADEDWSTDWEKSNAVSSTSAKRAETNPKASSTTGSLKLTQLSKQKKSADFTFDGEIASDGWDNAGSWGEDDWGLSDGNSESSVSSAARDRKKAESAARNEQRRKELAAKKATTKGFSAMKLGARKGD